MDYQNETKLLGEAEAANFLSLSKRTLQRYRVAGGGPAYLRVGKRRLAYSKTDLIRWLQECRQFTSTAAEARAA